MTMTNDCDARTQLFLMTFRNQSGAPLSTFASHGVERRAGMGSTSTVTCTFTIDNVVDAVFYNGVDITSTV